MGANSRKISTDTAIGCMLMAGIYMGLGREIIGTMAVLMEDHFLVKVTDVNAEKFYQRFQKQVGDDFKYGGLRK